MVMMLDEVRTESKAALSLAIFAWKPLVSRVINHDLLFVC